MENTSYLEEFLREWKLLEQLNHLAPAEERPRGMYYIFGLYRFRRVIIADCGEIVE